MTMPGWNVIASEAWQSPGLYHFTSFYSFEAGGGRSNPLPILTSSCHCEERSDVAIS
jgi:hypothetical protein